MNNQAAPSPDATVKEAINNVAKMTASANTAVANMTNKAVTQMGGRRRNNMYRKSRRNAVSRKNRKSRRNTRKANRR
jgi:hypothetical protein